MKVYTVHEPQEGGGNDFGRITFVKEGFCWPALFVPMFWLLWRRMWWVLLAWLAIGVALGAVGELIGELSFVVGVLSVLFALWFALEANGLRRWSLAKKGWRLLGVAAGRDEGEAEQSFFRRYMAEEATHGSSLPKASRASVHLPPVPRPKAPDSNQPAIGLFPQPE